MNTEYLNAETSDAVIAAAIDRVHAHSEEDAAGANHYNCAAGVRGQDRLPSRLPLSQRSADVSLYKDNARTIDAKKAAFHGLMVVAALIEYRCTKDSFRRQLCGAWAGFHIVSVILDLECM